MRATIMRGLAETNFAPSDIEVAYITRKQDCGQITDGAAIVFLASAERAHEYAKRLGVDLNALPYIKGWGHRTAPITYAAATFLSPQRQREVFDSDLAEQHRRLLTQNKDELLAELRSRHSHRSSEIIELLAEARLQTRLSAFDVLAPPNPDYRQLVSTICAPTLLVIGDAPVVSLETARELRSLNSRVRVEQIQNAGHGLQYDQPARFAAVVRSFLSEITPAVPTP